MVKVNLSGCSSFVNDADYKAYVEKSLAALEVLENETGAGNDFLGWKHLPSETLDSTLVAECEAVRDAWAAKNVDLVVVGQELVVIASVLRREGEHYDVRCLLLGDGDTHPGNLSRQKGLGLAYTVLHVDGGHVGIRALLEIYCNRGRTVVGGL